MAPSVSDEPPVFMVRSVPVERRMLPPLNVMVLPPEENVVSAPEFILNWVVAVLFIAFTL